MFKESVFSLFVWQLVLESTQLFFCLLPIKRVGYWLEIHYGSVYIFPIFVSIFYELL